MFLLFYPVFYVLTSLNSILGIPWKVYWYHAAWSPPSGQMWLWWTCSLQGALTRHTHQQSDSQGFTLLFWHRQVTREDALPVVTETEAGFEEAGLVGGHRVVDGCETDRQSEDKPDHQQTVNIFKHETSQTSEPCRNTDFMSDNWSGLLWSHDDKPWHKLSCLVVMFIFSLLMDILK